jgi:signal transduction histidine kinase
MGFRSMRERAAALSGEATIRARSPRGTEVYVRLPRRDRAADAVARS